jgi:hypothetical protein
MPSHSSHLLQIFIEPKQWRGLGGSLCLGMLVPGKYEAGATGVR